MSESIHHPASKEDEAKTIVHPFKGDVLAKGITTGVAVSTINHAGRSVVGIIVRHPLIVFGFGVTAGYFLGKYRKEIIAMAERSVDKSKSFILSQKEHLIDLVEESRENADEPDESK